MKILKVTRNKNGSATIKYILTDLERKTIKRVLGVKRLTKIRINDFIRKAIIVGVSIYQKKEEKKNGQICENSSEKNYA